MENNKNRYAFKVISFDTIKEGYENHKNFIKNHYVINENIRNIFIKDIAPLKNDIFFDSLRKDYENFDVWFDKCVAEERKGYVFFVENKLSALLIYNKESKDKHLLPGIDSDVLKICTFKVSSNISKKQVGDNFLTIMLKLCLNMNIQNMYLTVFSKHKSLINLISKDRFIQIGENEQGELIFVKNISDGI